jgi:hypothetical protein
MADQKLTVSQFQVGAMWMGGRAVAAKDYGGHGDEQRAQHPYGNRADIFRPLTDVHADEVGAERDPDGHQRDGEQEDAAPGQPGVSGAEGVDSGAHVEHGGAGKPECDADPIERESEETVPAAEIVARPEIEAAGSGILHRKRGHRNRQRNHEEQRGQQP